MFGWNYGKKVLLQSYNMPKTDGATRMHRPRNLRASASERFNIATSTMLLHLSIRLAYCLILPAVVVTMAASVCVV